MSDREWSQVGGNKDRRGRGGGRNRGGGRGGHGGNQSGGGGHDNQPRRNQEHQQVSSPRGHAQIGDRGAAQRQPPRDNYQQREEGGGHRSGGGPGPGGSDERRRYEQGRHGGKFEQQQRGQTQQTQFKGQARGGGGGGKSGGGTVSFVDYTPPCLIPQTEEDEKLAPYGWNPLGKDLKEISIPSRKDKNIGASAATICIRTNHFPALITQLPPKIYQYEVSIERNLEESPKKEVEKGPGTSKKKGAPLPPLKLNRDFRRRILQRALDDMREFAKKEGSTIGICSDWDKQLYTTGKLDEIHQFPFKYVVDITKIINYDADFEGTGSFLVKLNETVGEIETGPLKDVVNNMKGNEVGQTLVNLKRVYNILLKNLANDRYMPTGRSNLILRGEAEKEKEKKLGGGLVTWSGLSTVYEFGWKPYINFDIANSVFVLGKSVFEVIDELSLTPNKRTQRYDPRKAANWPDWARKEVFGLLRSCKVAYEAGNEQKYSGAITDILGSVSTEKFEYEGKQISIADYFRLRYGNELIKDGLCLEIKGRCKVPAELCTIKSGQSHNRKLEGKQTSEMIKVARKKPAELKSSIETGIANLMKSQKEGVNLLESFGVQFSGIKPEMLKLDNTRVIDSPTLSYGTNKDGKRAIVTPENGVWDIWKQDFGFLTPTKIENWCIFVVDKTSIEKDDQIKEFVKLLLRCGKKRSMTFNPQEPIIHYPELGEGEWLNDRSHHKNVGKFKREFEKIKAGFKGCDLKNCFLLVVLPREQTKYYDQVKQAAELELGLLTSCVTAFNVKNKDPTIAENIMLKLNSKLGGVNHVVNFPQQLKSVDILRYPTLILGADVTHPPPGSGVKASFAAVTGSLDRTGMPYMMHVQAQLKAGGGACEVISNLEEIVHKMLENFARVNGEDIIPAKIIYFRDGVGDTQFKELIHVELRAIREACTKWKGKEYQPKITFITVQKRHKTRFFKENKNGYVENAPPGTVVDSDIVHPTENDFYLLSHPGIAGTSRPTRYHVLWDDSDFYIEEIQVLSYYLCYMFVRCNRAVKLPAPTYYSHWAAKRAKGLTEQLVNPEDRKYIDPKTKKYEDQKYVDDLTAILKKKGLSDLVNRHPMHFV